MAVSIQTTSPMVVCQNPSGAKLVCCEYFTRISTAFYQELTSGLPLPRQLSDKPRLIIH